MYFYICYLMLYLGWPHVGELVFHHVVLMDGVWMWSQVTYQRIKCLLRYDILSKFVEQLDCVAIFPSYVCTTHVYPYYLFLG
jgi:hypothetical protein